jgi:hypothetical protein
MKNPLKGIYRIYVNWLKENWKLSTCNWFIWTWKRENLDQLCPQNLLGHCKGRARCFLSLRNIPLSYMSHTGGLVGAQLAGPVRPPSELPLCIQPAGGLSDDVSLMGAWMANPCSMGVRTGRIGWSPAGPPGVSWLPMVVKLAQNLKAERPGYLGTHYENMSIHQCGDPFDSGLLPGNVLGIYSRLRS